MARNPLYLRPLPSTSEALARIRSREREHRITILSRKIAALESAATRDIIDFTVEDTITTTRH